MVASVKQRNGLPCRADTNESLSQSGTSFLGCLRTSFQIKLLAFCILGASLSPLYPLLCPLLLSRRFTNHFCLLRLRARSRPINHDPAAAMVHTPRAKPVLEIMYLPCSIR